MAHWEPETLREADISESEGRIIRNVVFLRPGETLDRRRRYPESTVAEAAPLFSSTRLWKGHGSVEERRGQKERDPLDVLGVASDAKVDPAREGALVGMARLVEGHPLADGMWALLKDAETRALMGTSWEGQALQTLEEASGGRRMRVDRIVFVNGLAVVTQGNAGGAFEAYVREAAEGILREMSIETVEQLIEAHPALVAELLHREKEGKAPPAALTHEAIAEIVRTEVERGISSLQEAGRREQRKVQAQTIINESGLTPEAAEVALRLVDMETENLVDACREAIAAVQKIVPVTKAEPDGSTAQEPSDEESARTFEAIVGHMFGMAKPDGGEE